MSWPQRHAPSEIMLALCEAYNPIEEKRYNDRASDTDGYRIHINPDGSAVYLEGHTTKDFKYLLGGGIGDAIERCLVRRGLVMKMLPGATRWFIRDLPNGHPLKNILKLGRICRLERELCGEEDW